MLKICIFLTNIKFTTLKYSEEKMADFTELKNTSPPPFSDKHSYNFHISAQNIDCGYSLEPPRQLFFSRNKKNNVYHCKPQFKGV